MTALGFLADDAEFHPINGINLRTFFAVGDGVTDDTIALQNWLAALQAAPSPVSGYAPAGNYIFKSALSIGTGGKGGIAIFGDGPYQTIFTYAGASTTIDLFTVGDGISEPQLCSFHDFKITSNTTMTAGTGFHDKLGARHFLHHIVLDGQDGTGKLWNGFWFDGVAQAYLDNFEARGQNDGIRVNGRNPAFSADLFLRSGKVCLSAVGVRIGGNFGGFDCDDTDIIANGINVRVDQTLVPFPNGQIFFGKAAFLDTPTVGPSMQVTDTGGIPQSVIFLCGTWIASSPNTGFHLFTGAAFRVFMTGGAIINNQHDGFYDQSGGVATTSFVGVAVVDNGGSGAGYGFNASGPVFSEIRDCGFGNNFSGNIAATVNPNIAGGSLINFVYPFGNGLGMYYGSGLPTIVAAQGSLYMRTDGSSTTTRMYINTNGSTGWTNVVTST